MFRKGLFALAAMAVMALGAGSASAGHCYHGGGYYGAPRTVVRSYYGPSYGPYYGGGPGYGYPGGGYYGGSGVSFSIGF